jgi:hypothetical protein
MQQEVALKGCALRHQDLRHSNIRDPQRATTEAIAAAAVTVVLLRFQRRVSTG